ncbi:MAG: hypothetical protein ACSLE8_20865, partial [Rhodococcus sp. (in: high G+C Gram-positive bacteria)]
TPSESGATDPTGEPTVAEPGASEDAQAVEVSVDYSGFSSLYGGDYGGRLRVMAYPACFADTPEVEECADGVPVPSVNDTAEQTVTFSTADLSEPTLLDLVTPPGEYGLMADTAGATVYAVAAGTSSADGDYGATPFNLAGSWQVGTGSGEFSYSYPFDMPAALWGSTPAVNLSYSSGSVDAMTITANSQSPMTGVGWSLNNNSISRTYTPCSKDGNSAKGDLCWKTNNNGIVVEDLAITLNGTSSRLVQSASNANEFRLENDPGWRVFRKTGRPNGDNNGEGFKVLTPDGSTYWFGFGITDNVSTTATNSAWTVPVYGNDSGEPCYNSTAANAWCDQAWQWNLDRATDPDGNTVVYSYETETNYYKRWNQSGSITDYVRSGTLAQIDYSQHVKTSGDGNTVTHHRVLINAKRRCKEWIDPSGDPESCAAPGSGNSLYPEVPEDLLCDSSSCTNISPSFFSTRFVDSITSKTLEGNTATGQTARTVDRWDLDYTIWNPDGDGGDPPVLWLNKITQTADSGGLSDITVPATQFTGVFMQNRVNDSGTNRKLAKPRITEVRNQTGGRILVTYGHQSGNACDIEWVTASGRKRWDSNGSRECFAQEYAPAGSTPDWVWFNKYVVKRVILVDDALGLGPDVDEPKNGVNLAKRRVYEYVYGGTPAWRHVDRVGVGIDDEGWTDWRGYRTTTVNTLGVKDDQSLNGSIVASTETAVYRGMNGTKSNDSGGTISASINLDARIPASHTVDSPLWEGQIARQKVFSYDIDPAGRLVSMTENGFRDWPTMTGNFSLSAGMSAIAESYTTTGTGNASSWDNNGRMSRTVYEYHDTSQSQGLLTGVAYDVTSQGVEGTVADPTYVDTTCTRTDYWTNVDGDSTWIRKPSQSRIYNADCSGATGVQRTAWFYDTIAQNLGTTLTTS